MVSQVAAADCVALSDLGYVVPLDPPYDLFVRKQEVTLDLTATGSPFAEVNFFTFSGLDSIEPSSPKSKALPNGMKLHYSTLVSQLGGTAAPLATLTGWLDGDIRLAVSCAAQQETPDPEWCLPILEKLRREADGCETKED